MGNWKLEVGRMALYITFPVGLFHYFNHPEFFEDWVVKTKKELFPPQNSPQHLAFLAELEKIKEQQEAERIRALERS